MEGIPSIVDQITPTTLLLIAVTGSLVLTVLVGGYALLRRNGRPEPAAGLAGDGAGAPGRQSTEASLEQVISAYQVREEDDDEVRQWEAQLGEKLAELEERFASFAEKLERVGVLDDDRAEVMQVLAERGMSRGDLASRAAGLSEEQARLLALVSAGKPDRNVVGA